MVPDLRCRSSCWRLGFATLQLGSVWLCLRYRIYEAEHCRVARRRPSGLWNIPHSLLHAKSASIADRPPRVEFGLPPPPECPGCRHERSSYNPHTPFSRSRVATNPLGNRQLERSHSVLIAANGLLQHRGMAVWLSLHLGSDDPCDCASLGSGWKPNVTPDAYIDND